MHGRRPSAQLFAVHHVPDKMACDASPEGDSSVLSPDDIEELSTWVDKMLEKDVPSLVDTNETDVSSTTIPVPDGKLLLPLLAQAHEWSRTSSNSTKGVAELVQGQRQACALGGSGAESISAGIAVADAPSPSASMDHDIMETSCHEGDETEGPQPCSQPCPPIGSGPSSAGPSEPPQPQHHQGAADVMLSVQQQRQQVLQMQQLLLPQNAREAVVEIRPDSTIMSVLSPGAYGFQPEELLGQRLVSIVHGAEHAQLIHALQVLLRMGEIQALMGPAAAARAPLHAVRFLHHMIVRSTTQGADRCQRAMLVAVDSTVTLIEPGSPTVQPKMMVRSHQAEPNLALLRGFHMLPLATAL